MTILVRISMCMCNVYGEISSTYLDMQAKHNWKFPNLIVVISIAKF